MRKVLSVFIVVFIAYGWFGYFLDNSKGVDKLTEVSNLKFEDIISINAVNSDYVNVTNTDLNSTQAKELLISAMNNAKPSSIAKRPPKNTKLYIEIKANKYTLGLELMVPVTKEDDMYFVVVEREYDGDSYTQNSFGRFVTIGLYEFLIEANLINES